MFIVVWGKWFIRGNRCSFFNVHFWIVQPAKLSYEHTFARQKSLFTAWFCWDSRLSLRDKERKLKVGGTIRYGELYFEFLFRPFELTRLHAILHDATFTWLDKDHFRVCLVM